MEGGGQGLDPISGRGLWTTGGTNGLHAKGDHLQHHSSIHPEDPAIKKILIMFIQEIKRDIIYRRINIVDAHRNREILRVQAHMMTTITKIISLLDYQETVKTKKPREALVRIQHILGNMICRVRGRQRGLLQNITFHLPFHSLTQVLRNITRQL